MKKILDYIKDTKFRITIYENKIDICNYKEIIIFETNKIVINCNTFNISIKGNNLVINKVYDNEVLVLGNILNIEFR